MRKIETFLLSELEQRVSNHRMRHTLAVVDTARTLCHRFGMDENKAVVAGLGHDILKSAPTEEQWSYAERAAFRWPRIGSVVRLIESDRRFADKIIHGPAAAAYLHEVCDIQDLEILEAVAFHSSAAETMDRLASVLFISDKLEPGRGEVAKALLQDCLSRESMNLHEMLILAMGESIRWLESQGLAIAQTTVDLYNALKGKTVRA